jgi:hypothetical protein
MIKTNPITLLALLIWISCTAQKTKKTTQEFPFGTWMRSQEEEKDPNQEFKIFRPSSFNFPAARGRSGFICNPNGKFGIIQPSRTDGRDTIWGNWEKLKPFQLRLKLKEGYPTILEWKITSKEKMEAILK